MVIAHICNDVGGWGAGFVLAISAVSSAPEAAYRALAKDHGATRNSGKRIPRGQVQFVDCRIPDCDGHYIVANMIAQNGLDRRAVPNGVLVDYVALEKCLDIVFARSAELGFEVHMPKGIGSGLAGGNAETIYGMIETAAKKFCVDVTLWEFIDSSAPPFVPKKRRG